MRKQFYIEIKKDDLKKNGAWFYDNAGAYMCAWYGLFYGVFEEFKNNKIHVDGIDLHDEIWDKLRRFRNAAFHPQKEYWSNKFSVFMSHPESVKKIRAAHDAFGSFFLAEFKQQ